MFVFVFSLLVLQCAFALPVEEKEKEIESAPSRMAYARDFDRWFNWVPWGNTNDNKPKPSIKERIQILETRQKVLFDLVRCESYGQSDCSLFRTQAETVFETPSKQDLTPPTKILPVVTPPAATTAAPAGSSTAVPVVSTTAASTAAPVVTTAGSTAAPVDIITTEAPQSVTDAQTDAATESTTQA